MTTEDDFQNALDACPDEWHTRLVFADWLQERDDPRAEGYRALGTLRIQPDRYSSSEYQLARTYLSERYGKDDFRDSYIKENGFGVWLPVDWFKFLPKDHQTTTIEETRTRRICEEEAALAFAKLPESRRAELLAQEVTT